MNGFCIQQQLPPITSQRGKPPPPPTFSLNNQANISMDWGFCKSDYACEEANFQKKQKQLDAI